MNQLTRYRPSRTLQSLQDEVNRVFESLFTDPSSGDSAPASMWTPRMDLTETDDGFHLHVDLPGLSRDDVMVQVEDNRLMISGERKEQKRKEEENAIYVERSFGSFYRSLRLPKTVKENAIKASFKNGVLAVDIPKAEVSKPKKIQIA